MSDDWKRHRSRLANVIQYHPDRTDLADEARRDLKAARLEDHIRRLVDEAPPLTTVQRERLAALLSPVERAVAA